MNKQVATNDIRTKTMETAKPVPPKRAYASNDGQMTKDDTVNNRAVMSREGEITATDNTDAVAVAAALLGGRANVGSGGLMLRDNVKKIIMAKRLSSLTDNGDERKEENLVVPKPVLNLWRIVSEGSDGKRFHVLSV